MAFENRVRITPQKAYYHSVLIHNPFNISIERLCGFIFSLHEIECKVSSGVAGESKYVVISSDTDGGVRPNVTTNFLKRLKVLDGGFISTGDAH